MPDKLDHEKQTPQVTPAQRVNDALGGVQGGSEADVTEPALPQPKTGGARDEQAPDAGEIEWAGQVVKKAPAPEN